jgi:hypothetical protein
MNPLLQGPSSETIGFFTQPAFGGGCGGSAGSEGSIGTGSPPDPDGTQHWNLTKLSLA